MAFKITPYAGQTFKGQYADHHDIRAYLGFGTIVERSFGDGTTYKAAESKRLPLDFRKTIMVPLTDGRQTVLICNAGNPSTNGWRGKRSTHRCFAVCPDCGTHVPAGRTHQHKCK